jgi:hypothetical protein
VVSTNWIIQEDDFKHIVKEKFANLFNINKENIKFRQYIPVTVYTSDEYYNHKHIKTFNNFYKYVKNLFYDENKLHFLDILDDVVIQKLTISDLNEIYIKTNLLNNCIIDDNVRHQLFTLICPPEVISAVLNTPIN